MWMKTSHFESIRPASRTSTRFDASALSRLASAHPADPPPTMMKSYVPSAMIPPVSEGASLEHCRGAQQAACKAFELALRAAFALPYPEPVEQDAERRVALVVADASADEIDAK